MEKEESVLYWKKGRRGQAYLPGAGGAEWRAPMATKLNTTYISEALSEKLSHIPEYPITTIVAPIGYGKTRAVSWWAETCRRP